MLLRSQLSGNLLEIVKKDFATVHVRLWTDSEISLHWLSSYRTLKLFVQNKVEGINHFFDSLWGHTLSAENPADLVTCGCTAQSLLHSSLWFKGPPWILTATSWPQWPKSPSPFATVAASVADQQIVLLPPNMCTIMDLSCFSLQSLFTPFSNTSLCSSLLLSKRDQRASYYFENKCRRDSVDSYAATRVLSFSIGFSIN